MGYFYGHRHRFGRNGLLTEIIKVIVELGFLILGAWSVSEGCDILSSKVDASILGGLIIAWLNTLPEAIFFIRGLHLGDVEFAMGALSGSANVHPTIAVGLTIIIGCLKQQNGVVTLYKSVRRQTILLGISSLIVIITIIFGFQLWICLLGFCFYGVFFLNTILSDREKKQSQNVIAQSGEMVVTNNEIRNSPDTDHEINEVMDQEPDNRSMKKGIILLALGGCVLFFFSGVFIHSIIHLAELIDMSELSLAFLIAPIASEAPEVLESILLSNKGRMKMINIAFSNLIGGTATKTTLLMGVLHLYGCYHNFEWEFPSYTVSLFLIAFTVFLNGLCGLYKTHKYNSGVILVLCYFFNTAVTLISETYFKKNSKTHTFWEWVNCKHNNSE